MTQRLERDFRKSCNNHNIICFKLQVNPMAHHETVADFQVFNSKGEVLFIEAKECKLSDKGYGNFSFDRLTQESKLLHYHKYFNYIYCFVLIMFRNRRLKDSFTFLIPIDQYITFRDNIGKKSANLKDFQANFYIYELKVLKGSVFDLSILE